MNMILDSVRNRFMGSLSLSLCCLLLAGCGSSPDGPERFVLSGQVQLNGQPVPAGQVILMPDTEKGNKGPGAVGTIENGYWKTEPGKGPVSGPHIAMLNGYADTEATIPGGDPPVLFTEYKTEINVTTDADNVDFNVSKKEK